MYNELIQAQTNCRIRLEQQESALEQHKKAYYAVLPVLAHLSVPVSRLFSDEPVSCLNQILAKLVEQLKQTERTAESLIEQIICIKTGQLHLSKTAINFLQQTDISYQTGECLNFQSPKIRKNMLSVNPLTAYAIIVDSEKNQTKLLSKSMDTWLSAIVPVYTRSELADMSEGKCTESNHFLSSFDKEYFDDVSAYTEHTKQKFNDAKTEIEQLHHQINERESERKILLQFTYSADDEQKMQEHITFCQTELQHIQNKISNLDRRKTEIRERTEEIHKLKVKQQIIIHNTEKSKSEAKQHMKHAYYLSEQLLLL